VFLVLEGSFEAGIWALQPLGQVTLYQVLSFVEGFMQFVTDHKTASDLGNELVQQQQDVK